MSYQVDNAIIMAAGLSSRFAPLSYEKPKGLISVKGEVLIERQIKQLREVGITEIVIVTGYQAEKFQYLKDKFGVILVHNSEYLTRNNHYSLYIAKDYLKNSYICSADNYFSKNPFEKEVDESYYASVFDEKKTKEWCLDFDENDYITSVEIGGYDRWVMLGHVFFSNKFSEQFLKILEQRIDDPKTKDMLWEAIYIDNLDKLKMKIRRYSKAEIYEFDSLDELRMFDVSYQNKSHSIIIEEICRRLFCKECDLTCFEPIKEGNVAIGCSFKYLNKVYHYLYDTKELKEI